MPLLSEELISPHPVLQMFRGAFFGRGAEGKANNSEGI